MKTYIKPNIKITEIQLQSFIAASPTEPSTNLDKTNVITTPAGIEAKQYSGYSVWEDDEE